MSIDSQSTQRNLDNTQNSSSNVSQGLKEVLTSLNNEFRHSPQFVRLLIIALLVLVLPFASYLSQQAVNLRSRASASASLLFVPQTGILPPDHTVNLQLSTAASVSFVHVEVVFDRNKVILADESTPIVTNPQFQRLVVVSDKTTANTDGKIILALGVDPAAVAPTGVFEIAKLPFTTVSTIANDSTQISVLDANVLLTDTDANPVSLTVPTPSAVLTLNPAASPLPGASPSILPNPSASPILATPPALISCDTYCKSVSYSTGSCRQNVKQCLRYGETRVAAGDKYCPAKKTTTCCCGL